MLMLTWTRRVAGLRHVEEFARLQVKENFIEKILQLSNLVIEPVSHTWAEAWWCFHNSRIVFIICAGSIIVIIFTRIAVVGNILGNGHFFFSLGLLFKLGMFNRYRGGMRRGGWGREVTGSASARRNTLNSAPGDEPRLIKISLISSSADFYCGRYL